MAVPIARKGLIELLIEHQRRMERAAELYPFPLTLVETHLLNSVSRAGELSPGAIRKVLGCSPALVSKVAKSLQRRSLLSVECDRNDGRGRVISLTKRGRELLVKQNGFRVKMVDEIFAVLSANEQREIGALFHSLADRLNAPISALETEFHPILPALERLSRAFHLLSGHPTGLQFTPQEFHLARSLLGGGTTAIELCRRTGFHPSRVSRALARLVKQKVIRETAHQDDRRTKKLALTEGGRKILEQFAIQISKFVMEQLKDFSVTRLEDLLGKYLADEGDSSQFEVRIEDTPQALTRLRTSFLEEMARREALHTVPAQIFPEDSICVSVNKAGELCGGAVLNSASKKFDLIFGINQSDTIIEAVVGEQRLLC